VRTRNARCLDTKNIIFTRKHKEKLRKQHVSGYEKHDNRQHGSFDSGRTSELKGHTAHAQRLAATASPAESGRQRSHRPADLGPSQQRGSQQHTAAVT